MTDKDLREEIAKSDYEFGSPRDYFDWNKLNDKDKEWYLRKADQILSIIRETIYPFTEATPIEDGEDRELQTIVEVVQERTAQAQRDAAVKHYEGG